MKDKQLVSHTSVRLQPHVHDCTTSYATIHKKVVCYKIKRACRTDTVKRCATGTQQMCQGQLQLASKRSKLLPIGIADDHNLFDVGNV